MHFCFIYTRTQTIYQCPSFSPSSILTIQNKSLLLRCNDITQAHFLTMLKIIVPHYPAFKKNQPRRLHSARSAVKLSSSSGVKDPAALSHPHPPCPPPPLPQLTLSSCLTLPLSPSSTIILTDEAKAFKSEILDGTLASQANILLLPAVISDNTTTHHKLSTLEAKLYHMISLLRNQ